MICSISVVPERGMPMTKIGVADGSPPPDFAAISCLLNTASMRSNKSQRGCFVVGDARRALPHCRRDNA